jgi:hypothetical protein
MNMGLNFLLRYMTPATDRPRIVYELTKKIVKAFSQSPDVDFALAYVFSQRTGMQMRHQSRGKSPVIWSKPPNRRAQTEPLFYLPGAPEPANI